MIATTISTRISAATIALALLAGCSVNTGGMGTMRDGAPISGNIGRDIDKLSFTILSARGWQCTGQTKADFDLSIVATRHVPLTCNNGLTGTAIVAVNQFSDEATMTFALDNGDEGSLSFGGK